MAVQEKRKEFPPKIGASGNYEASQEDVDLCYRLILGRYPENFDVVARAMGQPIHSLLLGMLSSQEFAELAAKLAGGDELPHVRLSERPGEGLRLWLNRHIVLDQRFSNSILSSERWDHLLSVILNFPEFTSQIETLRHIAQGIPYPDDFLTHFPIEETPAYVDTISKIACGVDLCSFECLKGWATFIGAPSAKVSLDVLIDGQFTCAVKCDLVRADIAKEGYPLRSGFMINIPISYFDGQSHCLEFRSNGLPVEFNINNVATRTHLFSEKIPPKIRAHVDGYANGVIKGWALVELPETQRLAGGLTIRVTHQGENVALVKANRFRPDVSQALTSDPYCGFIFEPPYTLKRSSPVEFRFFEAIHDLELPHSPCTTSFGFDHREGRILFLKDIIDRLSSDLDKMKDELKSLSSTSHYDLDNYDAWFHDYISCLRRSVAEQRSHAIQPGDLISIVCPVFRPNIDDLKTAIASVRNQTYSNWELVIVDDGGKDTEISTFLDVLSSADARIKVIVASQNLGISEATNLAIESANGEWVAFFDHDDILEDVALEIMMNSANRFKADMLYSDEDKIDRNGYYSEPAFKPDWNYRLLLSCNYVCHLLMVRRRLLKVIGPLRKLFDGAQDHDLILRLSREIDPGKIHHVAEVLYHWRKSENSTASQIGTKPYAVQAGIAAVRDNLREHGFAADVENVLNSSMYKISWRFSEEPSVQIIIPFRDNADITRLCIETILETTSYKNYRIAVVDNWSVSSEAEALVAEFKENRIIDFIRIEEEFNFSRLNNEAARRYDPEYFFFMNNDLFVQDDDWLRVVVNEALADSSVAAVGGKFLYPNRSVQHGGVALGLWGVAGHLHARLPAEAPGYMGRAMLAQELSAVTAAGLLVRKDVFQSVGGFDEENLKVAFNDIDLCLRMRKAGYKIVWTPDFVAEHHESLSRGYDDKPLKKARFEQEKRYMMSAWTDQLSRDPNYSKFFDLYGEPFRDISSSFCI